MSLGSFTYDGTVKAASATTTPANQPVTVTYNGIATAPSAAGTYAVVATVNTVNCSGSATGTLTINKADNAITFGALPGKAYGNAAFVLTGSASSKLPVTYTSSNLAVATVYGSTVTIVGTGTTTITASQAGNANYNPAQSVSQPLVVGKATATITLGGLSQVYTGTAKTVTATVTPLGQTATLTYDGSATAPSAVGNYAVLATVNSANYQATASGTLAITKAANAITFAALPAKVYGNAAFALTATASSKLPVTYASSNPAVATVSGSMVTIVGSGTTTITASQAGDSNYSAAQNVPQSLVVTKAAATVTLGSLSATYDGTAKSVTVTTNPASLNTTVTYNGKTDVPSAGGSYTVVATINEANYQGTTTNTLVINKAANAITFGALPGNTYGDAQYALTGTASSGLPVTYTSSVPTVATVSGSTVTIVGSGTTTLTASQAGNANYNAATNVPQKLVVSKAAATVTLNNLGAPFTYDGTVKTASVTTTPANQPVTLTYNGIATAPSAAGTYAVVATVNTVNCSGSATGTLTINKADNAITFGALSSKVYGSAAFVLTASASSKLPVTYTSSDATVATVNGSTVTIVGSGTTTLTASQAGNANYNAAPNVAQPLVVTKAAATITLGNLSQVYNGTAKTVTATTVPAGQPVTFTYNGDTAAPINAGSYAVVATVSSANYQATASGTLAITKAANAITFGALPGKVVGDAPFDLTGTASSQLPVSYASSNPAVATVSGSTVTVVGSGSTTLTASQAGNGNYNAATNVTQPLVVLKKAQMLTPVAGSALASGTTTFTWDAGVGVSGYTLKIGSTAGASDLYSKSEGTALTDTVTTLPIDGRTLYVTLSSTINGTVQTNSYTYTAFTRATVTTLAGSARNWGSADGKGSAVLFHNPEGVAVDASGNVYVADTYNNTIRKIMPGGTVTTLAGSAGVTGTADGTGSAAQFYHPMSVAVDASGNVYVADTDNGTIRKITPDGAVKTLAGSAGNMGSTDGTGANASFYNPAGIAVDASGNLFVADYYNNNIRKITPAGVVTTLAGSALVTGSADGIGSAAQFNGPSGVAVDASGNLYVADTGNNTIRKITPDRVVTTLAGSATAQPGSADGTGSAAQFGYPYGVAVDASGNVYVADYDNNTIRKVTPAGVVTTLAGSAGVQGSADGIGSAARFILPSGVAVDASGSVYVADYVNSTIRKITFGTPTPYKAQMVPLANGGVLTSTTATFTWDAGIGVSGYTLVISGAVGDPDTYYYGKMEGTALTDTVTNLPTDGRTLYVTLSSTINGIVQYNSYTYTAVTIATVTTLAGSAGVSGTANATGIAAQFNSPGAVAVDGSGNVYVADSSNAIRKIMPGGTVTTLAGNAGDNAYLDGTGSAARFNHPQGVAVDASGNVYVADCLNSLIRKITPAGVVTTLAGSPQVSGTADGTGTAALFNEPQGVAVDGNGNVYVADTGNNTIRMITPAGVVTTLAGSPGVSGTANRTGSAAQFNGPAGVAVDASGNVDVADYSNNTIRKIIIPGEVVKTLAGSPGVYGSTDGTGSAALFKCPSDVAVDGNRNVYVADSLNHTIRKITPAGVVTTLVGSAGVTGSADGIGTAAQFNRPTGVAVDVHGNVYVADSANDTIRKVTFGAPTPYKAQMVTPANGSVLTSSTATFTWDAGVGVSEYKLYIGSTAGGSDLFAKSEGAALSDTVTTLPTDGRPLYVTLYSNINGTWQTNSYTYTAVTIATVTTLAGSPGVAGTANGTGSAARFDYPYGVAVDASGNVYVADWGNSTIRKITPAGVVTTLAGSALVTGSADGTGSAAQFYNPCGVAVDGSGNVYVADTQNSTIRKITPAGVVKTFAGTAGKSGSANGTGSAARFNGPFGVAVDGSGNVYVADYANHTIRKITPAGVVTTLAGSAGVSGSADGTGSAAQFYYPEGVAVDGSGNVYVADTHNSTIRMITPAGVVTTLAGSATAQPGSADGTGSAARFNQPYGVAVDSSGNVYVADYLNATIRKITPVGVVTTLAGSAGAIGSANGIGNAARFNYPSGVAVDASGNVYVADFCNSTIRKITISAH